MALPTGTISMSQVNTEICNPSTTTISLNDADVRALASIPTGTISMDDLRGTAKALNLTGGTEFTPGDGYKYHVFTSTGPLTGDCAGGTIEYMAIGGGGGGGSDTSTGWTGGNRNGGGGGAGGFLTGSTPVSGPISTTVTIGAGGAGDYRERGDNGNDTTVPGFSITAGYGGGGGVAVSSPAGSRPQARGRPAPLGSGGGAAQVPTSPDRVGGSGGPQGNPGANSSFFGTAGGGGGANAAASGRNGGSGLNAPADFSPIPSVRPGGYSGGGGGADNGTGVNGGGTGNGSSGAANSGGGGGGDGSSPNRGGNGGSGFFIFRYLA